MRADRILVPILALAMTMPVAAQDRVPNALRSLRPHQIVQAVTAERHTLGLTVAQQRRLDSLHLAIRSEPHRYVAAPVPGKAHENFRMQPMISRHGAYASALAVLTPEQRARAAARFGSVHYQLPPELQPRLSDARQPATEPLRHQHPGQTPRPGAGAGDAANPMTHKP